MKKLMEMFRHNQGLAVAIVIVIIVGFWTYGCDSKVASIMAPNQKVTRIELNLEVQMEQKRLEAELDNLIALAGVRNQELDRQDAFKAKLVEFGMVIAEGGTVNPIGVATGLLGVLGIGAVVDNRIKDKVIKNRPLPA